MADAHHRDRVQDREVCRRGDAGDELRARNFPAAGVDIIKQVVAHAVSTAHTDDPNYLVSGNYLENICIELDTPGHGGEQPGPDADPAAGVVRGGDPLERGAEQRVAALQPQAAVGQADDVLGQPGVTATSEACNI